jgi:chromosomal replication initiation ATPase DnaA
MLQIGTVLDEQKPVARNFNPSGAAAVSKWRMQNETRRLAIEVSVARVFAIQADDLRSLTRGRAHVALARQAAMYLAHIVCGLSLTEVGKLFQRDRTTVSHACALIEDQRDDEVFDQLLELLERVTREEVRRRLGDTGQAFAPQPFIRRDLD